MKPEEMHEFTVGWQAALQKISSAAAAETEVTLTVAETKAVLRGLQLGYGTLYSSKPDEEEPTQFYRPRIRGSGGW